MLLIGRESHTSWPLWFEKNTLLTGENNTPPNAAFLSKHVLYFGQSVQNVFIF